MSCEPLKQRSVHLNKSHRPEDEEKCVFLIFYDFINDLLTSQYYRMTPEAELRVQEFSNPSQLFNAPPHVTSAHEQNVFYSSTVGQISRERHEYTPVYRVCSNNVSQTYEQHQMTCLFF